MNLKLQRFVSGSDSTGGILFMNGEFFCFTCEDQFQKEKISKETRIPAGRYPIKLRAEGGMHERYKYKFPEHRGMLELQNVPNFTYIYIHIGNTDDDTEGCILIGRGIRVSEGRESFVVESTQAYAKLYGYVLLALERGEEVVIEVVDN